MEDSYKKSRGNAGLDGVQFQVGISTVFLLNALRTLKGWRLSSENANAGKFDDVVIELSDGSAVLLQAKHKDSKRITKDQLLSWNSRNADFSLPKYFLSYQQIKSKFKVKRIIICTNADVDQKKLKDILSVRAVCPDSLLHLEGEHCFFIKFNENILSDLKMNSESYYDKNLRDKSVGTDVISDGNLRDFLEKLEFFSNYPRGDQLLKRIDHLLSRLNHLILGRGTSSHEIYRKVEDWFKQGHGEYLTESRTYAMFCETKCDQFCKTLKDYEVSFARIDFSFKEGKNICKVIADSGYLLQALKIFHSFQDRKILFVNPTLGPETYKHMVEAFRLPKYEFLVLILHKNLDQGLVLEISSKLKDILHKHCYKKVILIGNKQITQQIGLEDDSFETDGSVKINTLTQQCREKLIKKDNINYQGRNITLEELLEVIETDDYDRALDSEGLEKLVKGEEIKVGTPILGLDQNIARFYINRTIEREIEQEKGEIASFGMRKEIFHEDDVFKVKENVILISDSAGMGKSTILAQLAADAKEKYPHLWFIPMELGEYSRILRDTLRKKKRSIDITELLDSSEVLKFTSQLERFVFSMDGKVVVMLDGFDEISPDYTELVLTLLRQCQAAGNIAKMIVTTRPHMNRELERLLKVKPLMLHPFTRKDQIKFLTSYWGHKLKLDTDKLEKCEKYGVALISKMSSWVKYNFTAIPLQVRMLAEVFQENLEENDMIGWDGCKEFLDGCKEEPKLPERMKITKLYDLFINKKMNIFLDKVNPSGNAAVNDLYESQFDKYFVCHQSLALKVILTNETVQGRRIDRLFSKFQYDKDLESNMLKIGILQVTNGKLEFVHRTFAEYFAAKSILEITELDRQQFNRNVDIQQFFIDEILCNPQFTVIRAFLESTIEEALDVLPVSIFENYRNLATCHLESQPRRSELIHLLAEEGCLAILKMILKCVNYTTETKNVDKKTSETADKDKGVNTLNLLQALLEKHGFDTEDEVGNSPLHNATVRGHLDMVKFLVQQGANVNYRNHRGESSIQFAAWNGNLDAVQFLAKHGGDITGATTSGYTTLHYAAYEGRFSVCKFLVERGADVNASNEQGRTVLHSASVGGHTNITQFLVENGLTAINAADIDGFTALHLAAKGCHLEVCKFLVDSGADVSLYTISKFSVLHSAAANGHFDIVKFLLEYVNADVNVATSDGCTALHLAAHKGYLDICKFLIQKGVDVNRLKDYNISAVFLASLAGHFDVVKFLVEHGGADVNVTSTDDTSALHCAAVEDHLDVCRFLLERGLDVDLRNKNGCSALSLASFNGRLDAVKLLVEYGHADVNLTANRGLSVLHAAAQAGHLAVCKFLVEAGSVVNAVSDKGFTALHLAARGGHLDVCKLLIEVGAVVNRCNIHGFTPLHLAVAEDRLNIAEILVAAGADVNIENIDGLRALQVATQSGHLRIVELLDGQP